MHQVAGGFVGTGEPRPDHHAGGTGRQRQSDIAGVPHTAVRPHVCAEFSRGSGAFENRGELRPTHPGHDPGGAHRSGPHAHLDDRRPRGDQVPGARGGDDIAGRQRNAQIQSADGLDGVQHLVLVAMSGIDDQDVDTGLGQRPGLGRDIAVDAECRGDAKPALGVDRGGVDPRPHGSGPSQHTAEASVRSGEYRHRDRRLLEQFENPSRVAAQRRGHEVTHRDIAHSGKTVDSDRRRFGHQADRAPAVDHDRSAVGAFVNQCYGVGDRVVGSEGDRGVGHQVAALDEVHRRADGVDRQILRQHHDSTAARDGLGHPPAGHRGHVGDHDGDRGSGAVGGGQVDVEPRGDVGSTGYQEDVAVGQVIAGRVPVEKAHRVRPALRCGHRSRGYGNARSGRRRRGRRCARRRSRVAPG